MVIVNKYIKFLLFFLLSLSIYSCTKENIIEYEIIGRSWTGDVGLYAEDGEKLFSTFKFDANGFGTETQYYDIDGEFYDELTFKWSWEDYLNTNLVLDYGTYGVSYMRDVIVYQDEIRGYFYLDRNSRGFRFSLFME